ncbi:MAG: hypothetical protein BroJett011_07160 [Chloroflexota bacterium]|nr:MAG: hypothetical protein BroJett011_07160 [Chloroflexota bacterium]
MSWISIGDWADEMSTKVEQQRRERLKVAAKHFGLDVLDVLRDKELEEQLLARYEATGLPWPTVDEPEDE